ncbi:hypothetical protein GQ44DRAFT_763117 [Phaeosphaeriaceae sp. PMI808]|nr:hypothetical protein GQ44DRAFT_763117 [Phaeosphaeriaceae sp. PMI808]
MSGQPWWAVLLYMGYCGSGSNYCSEDRCQWDFGTCDGIRPVRSTFRSAIINRPKSSSPPTPSNSPNTPPSCPASLATITSIKTSISTLTQDIQTRTLTSISTSTLSQETVTLRAEEITITARANLTLPGKDRPTTIISLTIITLAPEPVMVTTTTISTLSPDVVTLNAKEITVTAPSNFTLLSLEECQPSNATIPPTVTLPGEAVTVATTSTLSQDVVIILVAEASVVTITSTLSQETVTGTSTLPPETVRLLAEEITITAKTTLTLPREDRPTTITYPTTLTLTGDIIMVTATLIPLIVVNTTTLSLTPFGQILDHGNQRLTTTSTLSASARYETIYITSTSTPPAITRNRIVSVTSFATVTELSTPNGITTVVVVPTFIQAQAVPTTVVSTITVKSISTLDPQIITFTETISTTQTKTQVSTVTTNPALLNVALGLGGAPGNTVIIQSKMTAGTVTSGRAIGGLTLNQGLNILSYGYKFGIGLANPNLPQRIVQPILLCPGSTYALSFQARKNLSLDTVSVIGSVQTGGEGLVQMAGGAITGTLLYGGVPSIGNLAAPAGTGAVAGVIVIEATFGPAGTLGAKEVFIDEVVLTKVG